MTSLPDTHPISVLLVLIAFVWIASGEGRRRWQARRRERARPMKPDLGDCIPPESVRQGERSSQGRPTSDYSEPPRLITLSRGGVRRGSSRELAVVVAEPPPEFA